MVVWLVAVPIVILLLALAGANWKFFHLAYAKHLMGSDDSQKQCRGIRMVAKTHLRKGMSLEEVRRLLAPASVTEDASAVNPATSHQIPPLRYFAVYGESSNLDAYLGFDEDDRLRFINLYPTRSRR